MYHRVYSNVYRRNDFLDVIILPYMCQLSNVEYIFAGE